MAKKKKNNKEMKKQEEEILQDSSAEAEVAEGQAAEETIDQEIQEEQDKESEVETPEEEEMDELDKVKFELADFKEKYLRLYSEFDNFRRRTAREKLELMETANEDLMTSLIPVIDDFERAHQNIDDDSETGVKAMREGFELIYNKLKNVTSQKGLKEMDDPKGEPFNDEFHEAITTIPAPSDDLKDKIVDVIERGYFLKNKVIRFAKVVIGS